MSVTCRFCDQQIERSRFLPHYRRLHRVAELEEARRLFANSDIDREAKNVLNDVVSLIEQEEEENPQNNDEEINECIMCFQQHQTVLKPCNHDIACTVCLSAWWSHSYQEPRCPMCRGVVTDIYKYGVIDQRTLAGWSSWRYRRQVSGQVRRQRERLPSFV